MSRIERRRLGRGVYHVINRAVGQAWILEEEWAKREFVANLARFADNRPMVVYHSV